MRTYGIRTYVELTVDVEFDINPGYKGTWGQPAEPPSVENIRMEIITNKGERHQAPDWFVDMLMADGDDWLLEQIDD